jgi:hypothetical protein
MYTMYKLKRELPILRQIPSILLYVLRKITIISVRSAGLRWFRIWDRSVNYLLYRILYQYL